MPVYDFDTLVSRRNTNSFKWDKVPADALPLTTADSDYPALPNLVEALAQRVAQANFGYTFASEGYYDNIIKWNAKRHQFSIKKEELLTVPGVVCSTAFVVYALTNPGDGVLLCTPVYDPFFNVTREQDRMLLSVTSIAGGDLAAKNVIPETVTMGGTYRTYEPEIREMMGRRIQEIAQHVAQAYSCAAEVTLIPMFPSLVNNNEVIDAVYAAGVEQIGEENTIWKEAANMGSEDFAYYTNFTKAGFFYFGIRNDEKGFTNSLHNARFDIDEDTFAPALSVYAAAVLNLLEKPAWRSNG